MQKTLSKHGNCLARVIDKPILELLGIDVETELTITTDGRSLIVTPTADLSLPQELDDAIRAVNERHAGALRRLAE